MLPGLLGEAFGKHQIPEYAEPWFLNSLKCRFAAIEASINRAAYDSVVVGYACISQKGYFYSRKSLFIASYLPPCLPIGRFFVALQSQTVCMDAIVLEHIKEITSDYSQLDDLYFFSRIRPDNALVLRRNSKPAKIKGMFLLLVLDGELTVEVNLEQYVVGPNTLLCLSPGVVFNPKSIDSLNIDAYMLMMSEKFIQNININISAISFPMFTEKPSPVRRLTNSEARTLARYYDLLNINAKRRVNPQLEQNIATSLVAAMLYQVILFHFSHIGLADGQGQNSSRRNSYVREFIKLVHLHYTKERSVTFYASKLFISPKYLSLLVKESTGRSASRWIDEFVIMEAKNQLRYSGKNIQQVAYSLNFVNQSSFGKYFKHLTGLSPSEYQKS